MDKRAKTLSVSECASLSEVLRCLFSYSAQRWPIVGLVMRMKCRLKKYVKSQNSPILTNKPHQPIMLHLKNLNKADAFGNSII